MNDLNFRRQIVATGPAGEDVVAAPAERGVSVFPMLRQYLGIVRRRRWVILGAIVATLVIALIITLMMTPLYTASTTVEIQRENMNIVRVEGVEPEASPVDMEFYQTQYGLLRSRSLAERVVTDLRLADDPRFFEMFPSEKAVGWFENGRLLPSASTRQERVQVAATSLLENIEVSPIRLSRLVDVSFTSPNPAFSARVVDAWASRFIETTLERRFQATAYARRFLEQRLQQLRERLDQSERALVGYASRSGIVNVPGSLPGTGEGAAPERPIIVDDLTAMNRELVQATADRIRAQTRLGAPRGQVTEALENPAIAGLRQRRAELGAEYSRLMARFEPGYPAAVALREQITQLDRAISAEESRVAASLRNAYQASAERESALGERVNALKGELLDQRRRSIQYNIFQREVDTNRQLYDALLQRYKEIGVAGGVGVNNISIVDSARVPERPSSPRLILNMLLALIAGAGLGLALALALEQIDDAISDPSELETRFGLPLLGAIPKSRMDDPIEALEDRKSEVSEAYMAVQTSLSFATEHGIPRSLSITSTGPGEGKSTTAYAIAQSLNRTGRRILLIDGDLRAPSVHQLLGLSNERGLSNYLAGDDDISKLIHRAEGPGVAVMTSGPQPPSAAELLSSARLEILLRELLARFDHVILDSPPVMGLSDAPLLSSMAEGTVFVVESHNTRIGQARLAIARLRAAQAHIVGSVLTKFQVKRSVYGYGYEYGYSYGRGSEAKA
jgi:polysaccharide biosynthesis transport protein